MLRFIFTETPICIDGYVQIKRMKSPLQKFRGEIFKPGFMIDIPIILIQFQLHITIWSALISGSTESITYKIAFQQFYETKMKRLQTETQQRAVRSLGKKTTQGGPIADCQTCPQWLVGILNSIIA